MRERLTTAPSQESSEAGIEREYRRMLDEAERNIEKTEREIALYTTQLERLDAMPHDDVAEDNAYHGIRNHVLSQVAGAAKRYKTLLKHRSVIQKTLERNDVSA